MTGRTNYFDEDVARDYDESSAEMFAAGVVGPTVEFLAGLAGEPGSALEFGVGTGRLALPLSERIGRVHGVDLSAPMIERLRAKPGAAAVTTTVGDCATVQVGAAFGVVYIAWNTLMNLITQEEQVACFRNAAAHLVPGGCFVVDVMVPELQRLAPGERVLPFRVEPDRFGFDTYDVVAQGLVSHHYRTDGPGWRSVAMPFRYVWPAELDLMARLAGLSPAGRWGSWRRDEFTAASTGHVSVWRKPAR